MTTARNELATLLPDIADGFASLAADARHDGRQRGARCRGRRSDEAGQQRGLSAPLAAKRARNADRGAFSTSSRSPSAASSRIRTWSSHSRRLPPPRNKGTPRAPIRSRRAAEGLSGTGRRRRAFGGDSRRRRPRTGARAGESRSGRRGDRRSTSRRRAAGPFGARRGCSFASAHALCIRVDRGRRIWTGCR